MNLYAAFKKTIKQALQKDLEKANIHEVPSVDKVIVSMGIWSMATRKWAKDFTDLETNLATITGQKPHLIKSTKSISNFKLREDMPVMLRTTLRWEKAHDFITRLVILTLPRVRDFQWLSSRKFDGQGNYSIWFKDQSVFPELPFENVKTPMGVQVTITTTTYEDDEAKKLLKALWIIFDS